MLSRHLWMVRYALEHIFSNPEMMIQDSLTLTSLLKELWTIKNYKNSHTHIYICTSQQPVKTGVTKMNNDHKPLPIA